MSDEFMRRPAAAAFVGVSTKTLRRWEAAGRIPPAVRLSPAVQGWRRSVLEQLLRGGAQ